MSHPPNLLNDDGTASMATMLMLSHHAFRRDIARLMRAVDQVKTGDLSRVDALREEWQQSFRQALHGHHTIEDANMFPDLKSKHPDLGSAIDTLTSQHHQIDPLLEKGDVVFADLAHPELAQTLLHELHIRLQEHLAFEEERVTPSLRDAKEFPTPADDDAALMYAQGFAWCMQGIASQVLEQVEKLLPASVLSRLPDARAEFELRCQRVWGTYDVSSSTVPIPLTF